MATQSSKTKTWIPLRVTTDAAKWMKRKWKKLATKSNRRHKIRNKIIAGVENQWLAVALLCWMGGTNGTATMP